MTLTNAKKKHARRIVPPQTIWEDQISIKDWEVLNITR